MKKEHYLSIREFSRVSGVHPKSLRYYDQLGILPPAYVNPKNGYRYYTLEQLALVDAIQLCVETGIPLNQFPQFSNPAKPLIRYEDLVDYGMSLLQKKIALMQKRQKRLTTMRTEIQRSKTSMHAACPQRCILPERHCWLVPYEGGQHSSEAEEWTRQIILDIYQNGMAVGNSGGLLLRRSKTGWQEYLFVDVIAEPEKAAQYPQILPVPSGCYLCKRIYESNIHQVWDWVPRHVREEEIQYVIETELFTGDYNYKDPILELRCKLFDPAGPQTTTA